jgi:hypothetical protein
MAEQDYKGTILRFVLDSSREEAVSIARFIADMRARELPELEARNATFKEPIEETA